MDKKVVYNLRDNQIYIKNSKRYNQLLNDGYRTSDFVEITNTKIPKYKIKQNIWKEAKVVYNQPILTGYKDVDIKILLNLTDDVLNNICLVNQYAQSLCQYNYFWYLKINQLYPDLPIPKYVSDYKKFYLKFKKINNLIEIDDQDIQYWLIINHYNDYTDAFLKKTNDYLSNINYASTKKTALFKQLYNYFLNHKLFLHTPQNKKFFNTMIIKIKELMLNYDDIYEYGIYFLKNIE